MIQQTNAQELPSRQQFWSTFEYEKGEELYLRAMLQQAERNPGSVDWREVDEICEEMQQRCWDVDMAQSERTDWR